MIKSESCHVGRCYYIDRKNMWGNYCPETGEYYLAHDAGDEYCEIVLASYWYDKDGYCHVDSSRGYNYQVVRELLQLGHLTRKTLAAYIQDGGEVWWDQP